MTCRTNIQTLLTNLVLSVTFRLLGNWILYHHIWLYFSHSRTHSSSPLLFNVWMMMNINSFACHLCWSHCWVFITMHNLPVCWEEMMCLYRSLNIKSNAAQLIHKKHQHLYKYLYRMNALINWTIMLWCIFLYVPHCYRTECQWGEILLCSAFMLLQIAISLTTARSVK